MSINLAANGTPELYTLLDAGHLPRLDAIKCPLSPESRAEVERARRHRATVLLHGWGPPGYSVTRPAVPEPGLLSELSTASNTPTLSVHLDPDPRQDGLDWTEHPAALLEHIRQQADTLRRFSGRPLLENVPWRPDTKEPAWAVDPAFIREALDAAQAGLLLDLAHAAVACFHLGLNMHTYLAALPLERVQELHVSGPRLEDSGLRDRHLRKISVNQLFHNWLTRPKGEGTTDGFRGMEYPQRCLRRVRNKAESV